MFGEAFDAGVQASTIADPIDEAAGQVKCQSTCQNDQACFRTAKHGASDQREGREGRYIKQTPGARCKSQNGDQGRE